MKNSGIAKSIEKTSLMDIVLNYGGEKIKFNLTDELRIDEARINEELKTQPSYYGFLLVLMNKLERNRNDKKAEVNRLKSKLFIKYKGEIDPQTNRVLSNDLADAKTEVNKKYQETLKKYYKVEEDWSIIKSCVEAFQQRSHLIQSLSANVRNERNS